MALTTANSRDLRHTDRRRRTAASRNCPSGGHDARSGRFARPGVVTTRGRDRIHDAGRRTGFGGPTWSPDGRRLALAEGRYDSIYVVDADGSSLRRLTKRAYNEYAFAWSPDGRTILYGREDRLGIYVIGANGRNDHKVTSDSPAPIAWGALAWAPDGRAIAYATDRTGNGDLYVIGAEGRNKRRLTWSAHTDLAPSWAPG